MIGSLLVGIFLGSVGTVYASQKARENVVVAKQATQDFLDNEDTRVRFIESELNRLVQEGKIVKLKDFKYQAGPLDYTHFKNYEFWKNWCARNGYPYVDPAIPNETIQVPMINGVPAAT